VTYRNCFAWISTGISTWTGLRPWAATRSGPARRIPIHPASAARYFASKQYNAFRVRTYIRLPAMAGVA
jgi:hypothetical protein